MGHDRSHALDHIVVVIFENRSLDNVLGHLYGPDDDKTFDGVIGRDLTNPFPMGRARSRRRVVPYDVATDMDSPNPDSGRGVLPHQHPALQHARTTRTGSRSARTDRPLESAPPGTSRPWTAS